MHAFICMSRAQQSACHMSDGNATPAPESVPSHTKAELLKIIPDAAHYYDFYDKYISPTEGCASCGSSMRHCPECMRRLKSGFESLLTSSWRRIAAHRNEAENKGKLDEIQNRLVHFRVLAANVRSFGFGESCDAELTLNPDFEIPKLELDMISRIADLFGVRVCVYGCSFMDGIKLAAGPRQPSAENGDAQQRRDYQKVIQAMRSNDLKIVGPKTASRIVYCCYSRSDAGIGFLHRLPDIADASFWLDSVTVTTTVHVPVPNTKQKKIATCCSLCTWAYPTHYDAIFDNEVGYQHIHTVSHKRALKSAVLLHALHNFGGLVQDRQDRDNKLSAQDLKFKFPFSDIIFWYLHHDRVPHECKGEEIITEALQIYLEAKEPSATIGRDLHLLIAICKELNLSHLICQELARKNKEYTVFKKQVENKKTQEEKTLQEVAEEKMSDISAFCDIDLGMECLFQSNFFDSFQKVEHDSPIQYFVETLNECDKIQSFSRNVDSSHAPKMSSFSTKQWILHTAGRSVKLHGHGVEHIYETCEVEKTSNIYERWRHMIFSYALCSLLWNEFNGNKEGPIGFYPQRRNQCLGSISRHSAAAPGHEMEQTALKVGDYAKMRRDAGGVPPRTFSQIGDHDVGEVREIFGADTSIDGHCRIRFGEYTYFCPIRMLEKIGPAQRECVYASKEHGEPLNYVGHNIVAFAVGKRGDILRVAYNHNVLFTSTVDHAEERLIDSLYKDPTAFVQKSHSEILDEKETIDVEKHMQHISVYTSLEPCQQCSGKMHVALVPEVIFCQRDWDIQLMQVEMYEKFRKTRSVPASHFNFPPYEQLATSYYEFQRLIDEEKPTFFQSFKPGGSGQGSKTDVVAKKTMPYFLCTDDCQDVYQRGDFAFRELLKPLFCSSNETDIKDALNKLVLFHGLSEKCRSDWCDDPLINDSFRIRNFRPALNYKQQRILHDELVAKRQQWIQLRHKLSCSVTITFSSRWRDKDNKPVSENMVDVYMSPLADIVAVYIPRELNGLLKGSFKVTCVDRDSALKLHDLLKNAFNEPSKFIDNSVRGLATREAVKWLRAIQTTEHPTPKVRIDIEQLPRRHPIPAFALTASADVVDTKIRKYFDHLCSFSFQEFKKKSGQEKRAPLSVRIFDVPWQTCFNRMWINFESKDNNFALAKRRIWTVEFPSAPQDVQNLYEAVDFTPDNILDEYTQPYTQPIFDHTWFCACDEAFHNGKLCAGTRMILNADISSDSGMIGIPSEADLDYLIQAINSNLQIPAGRHIMSGYSPKHKKASRLKSGQTGVLLFAGRRLNDDQEYFPVRLDIDYSIHFLSLKCFNVLCQTHVRVCWQPPALPSNLFQTDEGKKLKAPFCFLKITSKSSKNLQEPDDKALPFEQHDKDAQDFFKRCKSIFLPAVESAMEKSPPAPRSSKSSPPTNDDGRKSMCFKGQGVIYDEFSVEDHDAAIASRQSSDDFAVDQQSPPPRLFSGTFCNSPANPSSGAASELDQACGNSTSSTSLFIHDLVESVTELELQCIFSAFGSISCITLSKGTPGYAYVYFSDQGAFEFLNQGRVLDIRGNKLRIMKMHRQGNTPGVSELCASNSKKQWKLEVMLNDLKAHFEYLTQSVQCSNMLFSCISRLKKFFDDNDVQSSFDKFQRTLGTFGKMLDLDIQVDSCSESSLFVNVLEASSSIQLLHVTSEAYELFEDIVEGIPSYTFCGHMEKSRGKSNACPLRFEISERSLATILASDMLQTPKGRHQVFALLKSAQDDPSKKLDWWNDKHPVKVGAGVDLKKLMSFLSDKFVRSSFNFAVKLCVEPKVVGISCKNECTPVTWLDNTVRLTGSQLAQHVVQYCISQKKVRSPSFLTEVKAVLNSLRDERLLPSSLSSENENRLKDGLDSALKRLKPKLTFSQVTATLCREQIEPESCQSSICMRCQCKCSFSSTFKGPIQNLLIKHDGQSKLHKHLRHHLYQAINGYNVISNCSKILSDIKNFGHYINATVNDLRLDVDNFKPKKKEGIGKCDDAASGFVRISETDGDGDDAASSLISLSSDASNASVPKLVSRCSQSLLYVRNFLETFSLECQSSESGSPFGTRSAAWMPSCSDDDLRQCDVLGSSSIRIHDVVNANELGVCIDLCRAVTKIVFQIRQRYESTTCCLLQLCCLSDDCFNVFLVHLSGDFDCEEMAALIDVLCDCELLLCFSESSENMLKGFCGSFGKQFRSNVRVLQKVLKPIYFRNEPGPTSFVNLIRRAFGKSWNDTWNNSGWDISPLHADQSKYAVLEVLATFRIFDLHLSEKLILQPESPDTKVSKLGSKKDEPYQWIRVQSCCSEVTKLIERKLEISRPLLSPKITTRNEDPIKEPNASNILHRICELERLLLLELSTSRLIFIRDQQLDTSSTHEASLFPVSAATTGDLTAFNFSAPPAANIRAVDELTASNFGLQLVIRRQRYDSCPSLSEQQDCIKSGKSYVRFCIDGPLMQLRDGVQIAFKMKLQNGKDLGVDMKPTMNHEPLDIVEFKFEHKKKEKGYGRVYGCIPEIDSCSLLLLFEPEYNVDPQHSEDSGYPFLEVSLQVGMKTLKCHVHSFHFKELVDASVLKCIELNKNLNSLRLKQKVLDIVNRKYVALKSNGLGNSDANFESLKSFLAEPQVAAIFNFSSKKSREDVETTFSDIFQRLEDYTEANQKERLRVCMTLKAELENSGMPLRACGYPGQTTATSVLEKFKFFVQYDIDLITHDIVGLLCRQGKQLERSCQFYFALKYYFAGLQFFMKLKQRELLNAEMAKLYSRFISLFENLLPLSNSQVYEQARSTVEFQRGVMRRGTMMK